jgi:gluconokinase
MSKPGAPLVMVVMGVSGSGKTTISALMAARLGWEFADADSFHSGDNRKKMSDGIPLEDEDRWPWLHAIAAWIDTMRREGRHGIVACSALKRVYRNLLLGGRADVRLIYLSAEPELVQQRIENRRGHFMPAALLRSQFEALEEPEPDENPIVVSVDASPESVVAQILESLSMRPLPPAQ